MSNTDGQTYFIGNPGEGIGDTFPKAKRTYHAVTAQLHQDLRRPVAGADQLHLVSPATETSTVCSAARTASSTRTSTPPSTSGRSSCNPEGVLNGDITHFIKIYVAKELARSPRCSASPSVLRSTPTPGPPIDALGAHVLYGNRQAFIVPAWQRGPSPLGDLARRERQLQLPVQQGHGAHRAGRGLQHLQLAAAHRRQHRPTPPSASVRSSTANGDQVAQGGIDPKFAGICATAAATSCAAGNGSLPVPKVDPNSATGAAIRVGLPNSNGSGAVVSDSHPAELGQADDLPGRPSVPVQRPVHLLMDTTH